MEVIASTLTAEAEKRKKGIEKAKEFLERINWFRLAKLVVPGPPSRCPPACCYVLFLLACGDEAASSSGDLTRSVAEYLAERIRLSPA